MKKGWEFDMLLVLYIIGIIALIAAIIAGFSSGSFVGFIICMLSGISSAILFFALARIIELQESILYKVQLQEEATKKSKFREKITCTKCNYEYDDDFSSCPHCGYRED